MRRRRAARAAGREAAFSAASVFFFFFSIAAAAAAAASFLVALRHQPPPPPPFLPRGTGGAGGGGGTFCTAYLPVALLAPRRPRGWTRPPPRSAAASSSSGGNSSGGSNGTATALDATLSSSTTTTAAATPTRIAADGDDTDDDDDDKGGRRTQQQQQQQQQQQRLLLESFVSALNESLAVHGTSRDGDSFVSLALHGPSKKAVATIARERRDDDDGDEGEGGGMGRYRGSIRLLTGRLVALQQQSKKKKNEKKERDGAADADGNGKIAPAHDNNINAHNMSSSEAVLFQATFKYHGATDIVKNWPLHEVAANLAHVLRLKVPPSSGKRRRLAEETASEWGRRSASSSSGSAAPIAAFPQRAVLATTGGQLELADMNRPNKTARLVRKGRKPNSSRGLQHDREEGNNSIVCRAVQAHDRVKAVPVRADAPFLRALGVTTDTGQPRPGMASKLRQCQKFVEVVTGLIDRASRSSSSSSSGGEDGNTKKDATRISVVDHGCGRGYLTFSLHSHLQEKYGAANVRSTGIDVRPKLVAEMNTIAESLDYGGSLRFRQGTIQDYVSTKAELDDDEDDSAIKVMIALHACDTATDDGLWAAASRDKADVIVVAPCCHKEIRTQLDRHYKTQQKRQLVGSDNPLSDTVWTHGIYRERVSEIVTDSMRALLLEIAGYESVQVFEFIDGEHTHKNCMIAAVKGKKNGHQRRRQQQQQNDPRQKLRSLAAFHGVQEQKLARWMGESLLVSGSDPGSCSGGDGATLLKPGSMPPI